MGLSDIAATIAALAALLGLIVGYVQLVLPRSLLPCIEFDVELTTLHPSSSEQLIGEVVCVIRNVGPGVGDVTNVQCRVKGRLVDASGIYKDGVEPEFSQRVRADERSRPETPAGARPLLTGDVLYLAEGQRNFIQPGVTQRYREPLALPAHLGLVQVWGAFEYHLHVGPISRFAAVVTRQVRAESPVEYTVRRTFSVV